MAYLPYWATAIPVPSLASIMAWASNQQSAELNTLSWV